MEVFEALVIFFDFTAVINLSIEDCFDESFVA